MAKKTKAAAPPASDRKRRFTPEELRTLGACLTVGLSLRTACQAIEWEWRMFMKVLEREPEIKHQLEAKAAKTKVTMAAILVEKARSGNLAALIFWLKTRCTEFREVILEGEIDDNVTAEDFKFE